MHGLIIHNKRLTFEDEGAAEPLLLLHAFPLDARMWSAQLAHFRQQHRVVAPNLPGFGGSEPSAPHASPMEKMAEDVAMLLEAIRVERAVVAGCSMGGYVALQLAQKHPRKVRGLVLSNTRAAADDNAAKARRELTAKAVLERGTLELEEKMFPRLLGPAASAATRAQVLGLLRAADPAGAAAASRGMGSRADSTAWLATCPVPVLVVHGADDQIIARAESEAMARAAPRGALVELPESGHLSPLEQPEGWNAAVAAWMKSLPR